jgi:NitT/TauT family transport system substrate-binding protein
MGIRLILLSALVLAVPPAAVAKDLQELMVTEPVRVISFLPLYIAQTKGYFANEGLSVKSVTMTGGAAHTNAVLSGQAFAFIGGPEHNAFAAAKGAQLRSVVGLVDRANVYLVAKKGLAPVGKDYAAFVRGKRIATFFYGGTPNSVTRFLLGRWGLDPAKDVTLVETSQPAILAAIAAGQADIGVLSDPELTQGIRKGLWDGAFFKVSDELGSYAFTDLNVRLDSIQKEPATVDHFVRAVLRGLQFANVNHDETIAIAKEWFPTMAPEDLSATIDRTLADHLWSPDGLISPQAWQTAKAVVTAVGILKADVPYEQVIDMQFVEKALAGR